MKKPVKHVDPERHHVMFEGGTEPPGSGKLLHEKRTGMYVCGNCGAELFSSETKYDSKSGWPSFYAPVKDNAIKKQTDKSLGMMRTEVICPKCGVHLGHLFDDGPKPTGARYCINSLSLDFKPKEKEK